jgi:F0F1-type ATP synthase assembly protein I
MSEEEDDFLEALEERLKRLSENLKKRAKDTEEVLEKTVQWQADILIQEIEAYLEDK